MSELIKNKTTPMRSLSEQTRSYVIYESLWFLRTHTCRQLNHLSGKSPYTKIHKTKNVQNYLSYCSKFLLFCRNRKNKISLDKRKQNRPWWFYLDPLQKLQNKKFPNWSKIKPPLAVLKRANSLLFLTQTLCTYVQKWGADL